MRAFQRLEMEHRDLKPENIMITDNGQVKIIDFGTVKVKGLSEIRSVLLEDRPVGSVDYIAPEYLLENAGNYQSDLFSLGVIVYEMLSGKLPYKMSHAHRRLPKSLQEWQYMPITEVDKSIPLWVDCALKKATHPAIKERHQAYSEFIQDLLKPNRELMEQHQQTPFIQKNPLLFWKITSALLAVVVVVQTVMMSGAV